MKILLVDDENIIAEGIKVIIEKSNIGLYQCDIANSGKEALFKAQNGSYDLVLTDIRMPGMSGLELVKEMKRQHLCEHFCILSGFSDFKYAQTAISLGVSEYLLKPVDKKELLKLLNSMEELTRQKTDLNKILREYQLQQILFGGMEDIRLPFLPQNEPVSLITMLRTGTEALDMENIKGGGFLLSLPLYYYPGYIFLVEQDRKETLLSLLSAIAQQKGHAIGVDTRSHSSGRSLRHSFFLSAQAALGAAFFTKSIMLDSTFLPPVIEPELSLVKQYLHCSILQSDYIRWKNELDKITKPLPVAADTKTDNPYVRQILQIVQCRFQEEELSLHTLSREIGLNPDYLGKLFKQETNMGFPEYLNTYRIQELLKLLEQNPGISFEQAALLIGFSNIRTFYRVFKRIMNMSPSEYLLHHFHLLEGNCRHKSPQEGKQKGNDYHDHKAGFDS